MKVRCLSNRLTEEQSIRINRNVSSSIEYPITLGYEYCVLGITIMPSGSPNGGGAFYEIENDWGQCRAISACLFEVVDARCSKHWKVKNFPTGGFVMWPEEFFTEYFHDDLQEGEPAAKALFERVVARLTSEFTEPSENQEEQ